MSASLDDAETLLDEIVAERLRRERRRLDIRAASKAERADAMSKLRAKLAAWRARAPGDFARLGAEAWGKR